MKDVHTEHCCAKHGCKYCDEDCTVVTGKLKQSYDCEQCWWEKDDPQCIRIKELEEILASVLNDSGFRNLDDKLQEKIWEKM